jgi:CRP/FNR family transcriptional regulator
MMKGPEKTTVQEAGVARREMVKTLKRCPVFQDLPPSELAEFASRVDSHFYSKGSFIFREGDPADSIHIVHDGLVRVLRHSRLGRKLIFAILAQGEIIATPGPSEKRLRVSSEAVTDVILLRVPKEEFLEYVAGRPKAAIGMIALLAKRFNRECDRSVDTLSEEVEIRLLHCLHILGSKFGARLSLTRKELAAYAGTTTETTIRVLGKLKEKGLILHSANSGEIVIADLAVLRRYARAPVLR